MKIAEAYVEIRSDSSVAEREVRQQADSLGKTFAQIFGAVAFGAGLKKAIDAGSRLEQAVGATSAIFEGSSKVIDKWAQGAAKAMGLSEAAARESLSLIGAQLKNFGFSVDEAQDKGMELVAVAADMAATFGGTTADAVEALSAVLRGENDTIEKYGVSITDARLKAKALELGLYDGKGALESNAKATAALELIMEQTSATSGQFARELDTVAGKTAVATAEAENSAASLGQALAPAYEQIVELVQFLAEGFGALPGPMQLALVGLVGIAAMAGPVGSLKGVVIGAAEAFEKMGKAGRATVATMGAVGVILGAAVALYSIYSGRKEEATKRTDELRDALLGEAGAQNEALIALAENSDEVKRFLDVTKKLGLTSTDVARYVRDGGGAAAEYGEAWAEATAKTDDFIHQLYELAVALDDQSILQGARSFEEWYGKVDKATLAAANAQRDWVVELVALRSAQMDTQATTELVNEVTGETADVVGQATAATSSYVTMLQKQKNKLDETANAADDLSSAIERVFSPYMDLEEATLAFESAIDDMTASLVENGTTLDRNTAAGRANRDALKEGVQAALDYGVAVIEAGGSTQDATNAIGFLTLGLKEQMLQAGFTEAEVDAYLATLGLTPENVKTTIELAEADTRKRELEGLLEQLGDIDAGAKADIQAAIDQGQFDTAERKMNDLARERGVTLRVSVTGGGSVSIKQSSSKVDFVAAANGYYADRPTFGLWGEAGPEAIIPLSRPGAAAEVLSNPAVRGPVTEALGAGGGGKTEIYVYGAERQYVLELMRRMDAIRAGG